MNNFLSEKVPSISQIKVFWEQPHSGHNTDFWLVCAPTMEQQWNNNEADVKFKPGQILMLIWAWINTDELYSQSQFIICFWYIWWNFETADLKSCWKRLHSWNVWKHLWNNVAIYFAVTFSTTKQERKRRKFPLTSHFSSTHYLTVGCTIVPWPSRFVP